MKRLARQGAPGAGAAGTQKSLKFLLFLVGKAPLAGELDELIESFFRPEFRAQALEQVGEFPPRGAGIAYQRFLAGQFRDARAFRAARASARRRCAVVSEGSSRAVSSSSRSTGNPLWSPSSQPGTAGTAFAAPG